MKAKEKVREIKESHKYNCLKHMSMKEYILTSGHIMSEGYEQALTEQRDELKGKAEAIFKRLWECAKCKLDCNKMSCGKELKLISKVFEEVK